MLVEARGFIISIISRSALEPTQPRIEWVQGFFSWRWSHQAVKLTMYCQLVPRLRMELHIYLLSVPSWNGQGRCLPALIKECGLRVFQTRMQRRILGPKREITGG
jgi:hypothetical protein